MDKYQYKKQRKLNEILSFVKVASLLFAGISLFEYFYRDIKNVDSENIIYIVIIPVLVLSVIYIMWMSVTNKDKLLSKTFYFVESFVFILVFLV